jgi:hypothetical protein
MIDRLIFNISGVISKMPTDRKKLTKRILTAVLMSLMPISTMVIPLVSNQPAQASYVAKWFNGNWNCKIDDRTAQMSWSQISENPNSKYAGKFRENGGSWTPISEISSDLNTLSMRFDRTRSRWTLTYYPKRYVAQGMTITKGRRQAISCTKGSQSDDREPLKPEVEQPPVILQPRSML